MHGVGEETDYLADDEHGGAPEDHEMHPAGIGFVHHPGVADDHTERGLDPAEHIVGSRFLAATLPEEPVAEERIGEERHESRAEDQEADDDRRKDVLYVVELATNVCATPETVHRPYEVLLITGRLPTGLSSRLYLIFMLPYTLDRTLSGAWRRRTRI